MHGIDDGPAPIQHDPGDRRPWYQLLTRYHWFVLLVAALGWLFDCLDQQLFILARPAAMEELITEVRGADGAILTDFVSLDDARRKWANIATSVFIAGWATGGLIFGMLGDRWGRAKTMILTILLYSLFTGLSALSQTVYDFSAYRFLTGLGVGGEFAVGVALVAEVMPARARPYALALLQALSAIGNVSAAFINMGLGVVGEEGLGTSPWRIMFLVGALPALLALVIRRRLKEPEQWQAAQKGVLKQRLGSYAELFSDPRWRKNAIVGLLLACSGVIGLWAVGFFSPDLIRFVLRKQFALQAYEEQFVQAQAANNESLAAQFEQLRQLEEGAPSRGVEIPSELAEAQKLADPSISANLATWQSYTSILMNVGAFLGMFGFGLVSQGIGRKPTFAIALLAAFFSTVAVFWFASGFWSIVLMVPIMGFCQLSLFAGYAIYFPELFPTRLRSTGTSFCYNVGRFIAAGGPLVKAQLEAAFSETPEPLRYAGVAMCSVFLIGLFVLPFAPETRGKALPE
jgi:MFS family permease